MEVASRLNERITIQQPIETSDGVGGITLVWQDLATLWAEAKPRKPNENYFNSKLQVTDFYVFTIRCHAGINNKMRVRFGKRYFRITGLVNVSENNEIMEIYCEEIF